MKPATALRDLMLPAVPLSAAAAFLVLAPHPPRTEIGVLLASAGLSAALWATGNQPRSLAPLRAAFHAGATLAAAAVAWPHLVWWWSAWPDGTWQALLLLPRMLTHYFAWSKQHYGGVASALPFAAPALAGLCAYFAAVELRGVSTRIAGRESGRKSKPYGSARFMPLANERKLSRVPGGIVLGAETGKRRSRLVSYPLEGAALTLAPPRTGKTALLALNLLQPKGAGFQGSVVVLDPRAELWCVTARHRQRLGRRVLLADPFGLVAALKRDWPELKELPSDTVRYNPLDAIRDGPEAVADINVLLDALLTPPAGGGTDSARHFYLSARGIIAGFIAWARFSGTGRARDLSRVRNLLFLNDEKLASLLDEMIRHPEVGYGLPVESAQRLRRVGSQEAGSNFSTIANQLDWLLFPEMAAQTAVSDFALPALLDGNTDLFVVAPAAHVESVRAWLRLWIALPYAAASARISAARHDLLIVIDEMPRLGFLKPVMDAYTMAAGAGVHFWGIAQSLSALEDSYGPRATALLLDNAELIQILGMPHAAERDAERFSAALGTVTLEVQAQSRAGGRTSTAKNLVRERLVTPHELMSMPRDRMYVIGSPRGMPRDAMKLAHAPYWERPSTRSNADPNPYVLRRK